MFGTGTDGSKILRGSRSYQIRSTEFSKFLTSFASAKELLVVVNDSEPETHPSGWKLQLMDTGGWLRVQDDTPEGVILTSVDHVLTITFDQAYRQ